MPPNAAYTQTWSAESTEDSERGPLAGTSWIPGVSEERTLAKIERLLERHLENPIDYLPSPAEVMSGE